MGILKSQPHFEYHWKFADYIISVPINPFKDAELRIHLNSPWVSEAQNIFQPHQNSVLSSLVLIDKLAKYKIFPMWPNQSNHFLSEYNTRNHQNESVCDEKRKWSYSLWKTTLIYKLNNLQGIFFFHICTKLDINLLTSVAIDTIFGYFWILSLSLIIHQFYTLFINFV